MYRQGDVAIFTAEEYASIFPEVSLEKGKQVQRDNNRIVLAYGEVTGHAHAIAQPQAEMWTLAGTDDNGALGNDNDRLLKCVAEVALGHEEHSTITIPAGLYVVKRQREYGPDELRTVAD